MAKDTEIAMGDDEIDALMMELEEETAVAVAPAKPKTVTVPSPTEPEKTEEAVVIDDDLEEAEVNAMIESETKDDGTPLREASVAKPTADIPKGTDPVASEESNFVLPPKMRSKGQPEEVQVEPEPEPEAKADEPKPNPRPPAAGLKHFVSAAQVEADTAISDTKLDTCIMQQASLYARYAQMSADAEAQAAKAKLLFTAKEGEVFAKHRTKLLTSGEKATEAVISSYVVRDPIFIAAKQRLIEAEQIAAIVKGATEALRQKRDMLIQMGADRREDGKGPMRVMARPAS